MDQVTMALGAMPKNNRTKIKELDPALESQQDRAGDFPSEQFGEKELAALEGLRQSWAQDLSREEARAVHVRKPSITVVESARNQFSPSIQQQIPDFIGNIVNLACVDDEVIARLLSHHIQSSMPMIVIEKVGSFSV